MNGVAANIVSDQMVCLGTRNEQDKIRLSVLQSRLKILRSVNDGVQKT